MGKPIKNKKMIITAILCVLVVLIVILAIMFLRQPKQKLVTAGQNVIITVTASSVSDMYGYQFRINFDPDEFEYAGGLHSKIQDIETIFANDFSGYKLVGATMLGDSAGFTGTDVIVCEMSFIALKDGDLSEMSLSMSNVGVVKSDLEYITDIPDWSMNATVAP